MSAPISAPPWDLAAGNRWTIQSEDHRIANDRGNETVVDAKGNVVAYVSGNNDEGGNGALLAAAPALLAFTKLFADDPPACASQRTKPAGHGDCDCWSCSLVRLARAALKQAGQP